MRELQLALAALGLSIAAPALAAYPERPVTIIVPYNPGGGTDTGVRTWAPFLETCLGDGAQVVVVNKPGAGAALGVAELATSKPDGYTIGILNSPNFYTNGLTRQVPWTIDSFDYLGNLVGINSTIAVRPDSPIRSLQDLIDLAKSSDRPINFGVSGIGGDDQLTNHLFATRAGIVFNFVPLDGDANTRNALMGGHIDVIGASDAAFAPFLSEIRPIAVASEERSPMLPDTPTFKEQGHDIVSGSRHLIGAPAGLPEEARTRLAACITEIAANPEFVELAKSRSVPLLPMTDVEVRDFVVEDARSFTELWASDPWTTAD